MSLNNEKNDIRCYKCETTLELASGQHVPRSERCPSCHADLRCCRMCVFYDKSSYNECKEPTADRVVEKEKANFCDFFKAGNKLSNKTAKDDVLAKANALFKN